MEYIIQDISNWVNYSNKQIIIGISGHGAAGKTTFATNLMNHLNIKSVNYINTDPYIISSDIRKYTTIHYTYENEEHASKMTACHPDAHHLLSLERDVQMVRDGYDFYTLNTDYMKSELIQSNHPITIVEGMSVAFLNPELFDLKLYFYTDSETEILRRSTRDVVERGRDIAYLKQSHAERRIQYEVFMHPFSENFDLIFYSSNDTIALERNTFRFIE